MSRRLLAATGLAVVLSAPAFAVDPAPAPVELGSNILQLGVGTYQGVNDIYSFNSGGGIQLEQ